MSKILLTGGGSGGSVAPLIAVYEFLREKGDFGFYWIGTRKGPERRMLAKHNIQFTAFPAAKLRRYISLRTMIEPLVFLYAFVRSLIFLIVLHPQIIVSAGGFVSVPVVWAGWLLKIPSLIHQQDIQTGLSNKLMTLFAKKITVTFEEQLKNFPKKKTVVTGNPVRVEIKRIMNHELRKSVFGTRNKGMVIFNLEKNIPTLLVVGGGTGANQINELVWRCLKELTEFCQIIHITGKYKSYNKQPTTNNQQQTVKSLTRYHAYGFLTTKMSEAIAAADVVVSRAGMSFLTELSVLGKPSIIIPIPHSHQEANAEFFASKNAVVVLGYGYEVTKKEAREFVNRVKELIANKGKREDLSRNIQKLIQANAAERITKEVLRLL